MNRSLAPHSKYFLLAPKALFAVALLPLSLGFAVADGNPQNPQNWTMLPTVLNGINTFIRKEQVLINGVPTIETATYTQAWGQSELFRNGVSHGNSGLPTPFPKMVWEEDTISAVSQGTVELRMQWNQGPFNRPPRTVRVKISSYASVIVGEPFTTEQYVVDNGLNSVEEIELGGNYSEILKRQPEIRTIKVDAQGLATFKLTCYARSFRTCGETVQPNDVVNAEAGSAAMAVDGRNVTVLVAGGAQWQKLITGGTVTHPFSLDWMKNTHHDVLVHQSPVTFSYEKTAREPVPLRYESPSLSTATYQLSLPTRYGYNHGSEPPGHLPECNFQLYFVGFATSEGKPIERYSWSNGLSGNLPDESGSYNFPSMVLDFVKHHLTQWDQGGEKWVTWTPTSSTTADVTLRYTWSDGVFAEANSIVSFVEPRYDISSTAVVDDERLTNIGLNFLIYNRRVPAGVQYSTAEGIFEATDFSRQSFQTVTGLVSAIFGVSAFWQPWLGIPSGIAAALGLGAEFFSDTSVIATINRAGDPLFSWWTSDGITTETAPTAWNVNDWSWEVDLRPCTKKQLTAFDKYSASGYDGRFVEYKQWGQVRTSARLLHRYYREAGTGAGPGAPGG